MFPYLFNFIHAFITVSLLAGLLLALLRPVDGRKAVRSVVIGIAAGLLAGIAVYLVSLRQETLTAARTFLYGTAILAALGNGGAFLLPGKRSGALPRWGAPIFTAALSAVTIFSFLGQIAEQALSAATVLNTELILNIAGIMAGVSLTTFLIPLTDHLAARNGRGIVAGLLLFASFCLVGQWSADVLLGLMRLEMVELTSFRLSYVAKIGKYSYLFPYLQALLIATLALVFFARRPVVEPLALAQMQKAERRKAQSRLIFEMHWFKAALASVAAIFAIFLYNDLYASRPLKISPPVKLTPNASGLIKIAIDQVKDGKLHRYAMVTNDGHVVRFFLINRALGQSGKIGVVYDACMLCGDMGYIQEKNEVICIACNVRIFIPSIGKAGGCNPIPLTHKLEGDHVVISAAELDKGARYFSEVVALKVKDPVTGRVLDNLKAPHRYEYNGKTYFFESEQSAEKFKGAPEKYVGEQQSRYYRVQGFRES